MLRRTFFKFIGVGAAACIYPIKAAKAKFGPNDYMDPGNWDGRIWSRKVDGIASGDKPFRSTPAMKRHIHKVAKKLDCVATECPRGKHEEEIWKLNSADVRSNFTCTDIVQDNSNMVNKAIELRVRAAHQCICEIENSRFIAKLKLVPLRDLTAGHPHELILCNFTAICYIEDVIGRCRDNNAPCRYSCDNGNLYYGDTPMQWLSGLGTDRTNEFAVAAVVHKDEYESLPDKLKRYDEKFDNA